MNIQQITKKQHYVPQLLLKGFTINNEKINVYGLSEEELRQQSIKEVFFQNYLYDTDNKVESIFRDIESEVSGAITQFRAGNYELLQADKQKLLNFICSQQLRTPSSRDDTLSLAQSFVEDFIKRHIDSNFGKPEDNNYGEFTFTKEYKREMVAKQSCFGVIMAQYLNDLSGHILVNDTQQEFIISDNPAILYNWFYCESNSDLTSSPFAKGAQLFLPISHKLCLCYYDSKIYKYRQTKNSNVSKILNINDIDWINQLQVSSACKLVGFRNIGQKFYVKNLLNKNKGKLFNSYFLGTDKYNIIGKKISCILGKPDFFKILKKANTNKLASDIAYRNIEQIVKLSSLAEVLSKMGSNSS